MEQCTAQGNNGSLCELLAENDQKRTQAGFEQMESVSILNAESNTRLCVVIVVLICVKDHIQSTGWLCNSYNATSMIRLIICLYEAWKQPD